MNPDLTPLVNVLKNVEGALHKGLLDYANVVILFATFVALVFYTCG